MINGDVRRDKRVVLRSERVEFEFPRSVTRPNHATSAENDKSEITSLLAEIISMLQTEIGRAQMANTGSSAMSTTTANASAAKSEGKGTLIVTELWSVEMYFPLSS